MSSMALGSMALGSMEFLVFVVWVFLALHFFGFFLFFWYCTTPCVVLGNHDIQNNYRKFILPNSNYK